MAFTNYGSQLGGTPKPDESALDAITNLPAAPTTTAPATLGLGTKSPEQVAAEQGGQRAATDAANAAQAAAMPAPPAPAPGAPVASVPSTVVTPSVIANDPYKNPTDSPYIGPSTIPGIVPMEQKGEGLVSFIADRLGPNIYTLGGDAKFAGDLSAAMQNSANTGAANTMAAGTAAQALGANAGGAMQAGGAALSDFSLAQAAGIQGLASGITAQGASLGAQADAVNGRAAPVLAGSGNESLAAAYDAQLQLGEHANAMTAAGNAAAGRATPGLDTSQQDSSLYAAGQTGDILGGAGLGLLAAGQAAQGRAAPTLDTGAQNAALANAQSATEQLGQTGATMGQMGLQAGNRATPAANYGQANQVLGGSLDTAGRLGSTAQQATAAAQLAGQRGGVGPADYAGSRSALDQLAGLESGPGQSGAEALLRQGAGMSAQQALMTARSGRGFGGNAQGVSEAMRQNAATMQGVENQAAQLRAQEFAQTQQRKAGNLTTQAGMLSGQSQSEQAAALQSRAQNDQAQAALFGIGNQANASQAGLQQSAAGQLSAQQQSEQAAALQARAQNDQSQNALLAGQAAAQQNVAALGQSQAQQYGQQSALNQAAQLQATGQNDSALAALSGLGMQGIAQTAGIQQANAAQQGQQAVANQAAELQSRQINDQAQSTLLGQGANATAQQAGILQGNAAQYTQADALNQAAQLQATGQNDAAAEAYRQLQLQAMQSGAQTQATGAQLGQAGMQAGLDIYGQGIDKGLAGNQAAMQAAAQATAMQQGALTSTGQIAQIASSQKQQQIDAILAEYGIDKNVAVNRREETSLLGPALSAVGTGVAAAALAASDRRGKKGIKPAKHEELFLSPGDSLLADKPQRSALDQLSGEDLDAVPDPYGLSYRRPAGPLPPRRYVSNGPAEDPGDNGDYEAPDAYKRDLPQPGGQHPAMAGMLAGLGAFRANGGLGQVLSSDRDEKTSIVDLDEYDRQHPEPNTDLRAAKGYSYEYKDPDAPGAAHGRQVGPMAQHLLKTSAADSVVKGRDGKLGVDTGRLSLRNTAAISQQQRELDELKAMIAELGAGLPTTSGFERRSSY